MITIIKIHVLDYSAFSHSWPNNIEQIFSSNHHDTKKLVVDRKYIYALYGNLKEIPMQTCTM